MKLVWLIKMCLTETCSRIRAGRHLSGMFPFKNGLKLNGTHQLLVYADDINIFGGNVYIIKENAGALIVASMEIGL